MIESREIAFVPAHACFAVGYACVCAWAIVLLFSPAFGSPSDIYAAPMSMLPGLVACLSSIVFLRTFPSISGKTPLRRHGKRPYGHGNPSVHSPGIRCR